MWPNSSSIASLPAPETDWYVATTTRLTRNRSCRGFSATTIWMVLQFGLAMMLRRANRFRACGLTSGTTSGTSGSMRNWLVLSITTQLEAAARGAWTAETAAPGLNRAMSQPWKSKLSSGLTFSTRVSPNETSAPADRPEATAATSSAGKRRSARVFSISRPTAPVAPTTATL